MVYPNQVREILTIGSGGIFEEVEIFDLSGHRLLKKKNSSMDVSHLSGGMYLVRMRSNGNYGMARMVQM